MRCAAEAGPCQRGAEQLWGLDPQGSSRDTCTPRPFGFIARTLGHSRTHPPTPPHPTPCVLVSARRGAGRSSLACERRGGSALVARPPSFLPSLPPAGLRRERPQAVLVKWEQRSPRPPAHTLPHFPSHSCLSQRASGGGAELWGWQQERLGGGRGSIQLCSLLWAAPSLRPLEARRGWLASVGVGGQVLLWGSAVQPTWASLAPPPHSSLPPPRAH